MLRVLEKELEMKMFIFCPVFLKGNIVGVIIVDNPYHRENDIEKQDIEQLQNAVRLLGVMLMNAKPLRDLKEKNSNKTFIVHGHNHLRKEELKNYLQNTLHFPEPIILHEKESKGKTIIEKFEKYSDDVDFVFALLTPDDNVVSSDICDDEKRRARQNVIFEIGYFMGQLGRDSGRVLLLHEGSIELPTDILGLIYIDISNGVETAGERIRKELNL